MPAGIHVSSLNDIPVRADLVDNAETIRYFSNALPALVFFLYFCVIINYFFLKVTGRVINYFFARTSNFRCHMQVEFTVAFDQSERNKWIANV